MKSGERLKKEQDLGISGTVGGIINSLQLVSRQSFFFLLKDTVPTK